MKAELDSSSSIAVSYTHLPVYLRDSCNFAVLIDAEDEQRSLTLLEKAKIALEKKAYTAKTM